MSIGENIKRYREAKQLSLAKFSTLLGLSVEDCQRIEGGQRTVSSNEIRAICGILDVNIDALFADNIEERSTEGSLLMPIDELQNLLGKMKD